MTLNNLLTEYTLLPNPPEYIDVSYLYGRLRSRFGMRRVRDDVPPADIPTIAQNVVDVNNGFLKSLFEMQVSPFKTWAETTTNTRNITTHSTGNATSNVTGNSSAQSNVNAFNSATSAPERDSTEENAQHGTSDTTTDGTTADNDSGERSGYGYRDYFYALEHIRAAYDVLINLITDEILNLYVSPLDVVIGGAE